MPAHPVLLLALAASALAADPADPCAAFASAQACRAEAVRLLTLPAGACMNGHADACQAWVQQTEEHAPINPARARAYLGLACSRGEHSACDAFDDWPGWSGWDQDLNPAVYVDTLGYRISRGYGDDRPLVRIPCRSEGPCTGPDDYDLDTLSDELTRLRADARPGSLTLIVVAESVSLPAQVLLEAVRRSQVAPDHAVLFPTVYLARALETP